MRIGLFKTFQSDKMNIIRNILFLLFINVSGLKSECDILFDRQPRKKVTSLKCEASVTSRLFNLFAV